MTKPAWLTELNALLARARRDPSSRYAQLATVGTDGAPRCRTVVIRRVSDLGLYLVTDARSAKVEELRHNPRAELCWYWQRPRTQVRLRGELRLLEAQGGDPMIRSDLWRALSTRSRSTFFWPEPGTPCQEADTYLEESSETEPPDSFLVGILTPVYVETLVLRGHPHDRRRFEREGSGSIWTETRLRP